MPARPPKIEDREAPGKSNSKPQDEKVPTPVTPDDEPTAEEYETRRLELIAKLPEPDKRPQKLVGKLALITGIVGQIPKSGRNTFHNYRYAKESDLVEAIRPLMAELGVWLWWSLASDPEKQIVAHQRLIQQRRVNRNSDQTIDTASLTVISGWFKFIDGDTGEETPQQLMMGYGDDTSDKGLYKAYTGMEKYFLMKTFLVSTGDDPEADTRADQRAAARDAVDVDVRRGGGGNQPRRQGQPQRQQPGPGGRQQEGSRPQVRELGELLRKSGATKSDDAAILLGRVLDREIKLEGDDKPAELRKVIDALTPRDIGKAVHELNKLLSTKPNGGAEHHESPAPDADAAPVEGKEEAEDPDEGWTDEGGDDAAT